MKTGRSIKFLAAKVQARLKRVSRCGLLVAGFLNRVEKKGKTTTVYVPNSTSVACPQSGNSIAVAVSSPHTPRL